MTTDRIPDREPNCTADHYYLDEGEQWEIMDRLSHFPHVVTSITVRTYCDDDDVYVTYRGKRLYKTGRVGKEELVMP